MTHYSQIVCGLIACSSLAFSAAAFDDGILDPRPRIHQKGQVLVYDYGSSTPRLLLEALGFGLNFGVSADWVSDLTGDGIADIAVGAPFAGTKYQGAVFLYSGTDGTEIGRIDGPYTSSYIGQVVRHAGDFNGDGVTDIATRAIDVNDDLQAAPVVHIYSSDDLRLIASIRAGDYTGGFGFSIASAGDINGDGADELAIGAPTHQVTGSSATGRVYIFNGSTDYGTLDAEVPDPANIYLFQANTTIDNDDPDIRGFGTEIAPGSTNDESYLLVLSLEPESFLPGNQAIFNFHEYSITDSPLELSQSTGGKPVGDADNTGQVDAYDALAVAESISSDDGLAYVSEDTNQDGVVDSQDLAVVVNNAGSSLPSISSYFSTDQVVSKLNRLVRGTGRVTLGLGDVDTDGTFDDPIEPEPCDDDDDNDDDPNNDNDGPFGDINADDGGTGRPDGPGLVDGGPGCGLCTTSNLPTNPCDDDPPSDDHEGCCPDYDDPCTVPSVEIHKSKYVGLGLTGEIRVTGIPEDWSVGLSYVDGPISSHTQINEPIIEGEQRWEFTADKYEAGTVRFALLFTDPDGKNCCRCVTAEIVEYEDVAVGFRAFIPCDVVPLPPGAQSVDSSGAILPVGYDFVNGNDRFLCGTHDSIFNKNNPSFKARANLIVNPTKTTGQTPPPENISPAGQHRSYESILSYAIPQQWFVSRPERTFRHNRTDSNRFGTSVGYRNFTYTGLPGIQGLSPYVYGYLSASAVVINSMGTVFDNRLVDEFIDMWGYVVDEIVGSFTINQLASPAITGRQDCEPCHYTLPSGMAVAGTVDLDNQTPAVPGAGSYMYVYPEPDAPYIQFLYNIDPDAPDISDIMWIRDSVNSVWVVHSLNAGLPIVSFSCPITAYNYVHLVWEVDADSGQQEVEATMYGVHDPFPTHAVWVGDQLGHHFDIMQRPSSTPMYLCNNLPIFGEPLNEYGPVPVCYRIPNRD